MENTKAAGLNRDVMHYKSTTHERLPCCRQSTNKTWTFYSPPLTPSHQYGGQADQVFRTSSPILIMLLYYNLVLD